MKIQYIVKNYPQLSQTYIKSEINALLPDHEISIIATSVPNLPDPDSLPYQQISEEDGIVRQIENFKPDIIHSHYLVLAKVISRVSRRTGIPFTIRAHSFDALENGLNGKTPPHIDNSLGQAINQDLCRGVLIFPFTRHLLTGKGQIDNGKLIDAPPVVDVKRFRNKEKNGGSIMNTGACIPKKSMETFVELSKMLPEQTFNLYGLGHNILQLEKFNQQVEGNVNFIEPVPYYSMPDEYKKHKFLVYTANSAMKTVGWPMAIMEAMASGTMVCMPNIRPDIRDYIGDAGYIYDEIGEVIEILRRPVDERKRQLAFEYSKEFDISKQITTLTELW